MAEFFDFRRIGGPKDSKAENFEMLCAQLVELEFPKASRVRCNPGDRGIDILVGPAEKPTRVFQCKYFIGGIGKAQRAQILRSFNRIYSDTPHDKWPDKWTLCLPVDLSLDEQSWLQRLKWRFTDVRGYSFSDNVSCWGETKLLNLLCKHPNVAKSYFDLEVSQKIEEIHQAVLRFPVSVDDQIALDWLYIFFDRPAFKDPFHLECSYIGFDKAMEDTIAALNTGILRTREGQIIARSKPRHEFSNQNWRTCLQKVVDMLMHIRREFAHAVRIGIIGKTDWGFGFLDVNSDEAKEFVYSMNHSRNAVLSTMNELFSQIGKEPLAMVREAWCGFISPPRARPVRHEQIKRITIQSELVFSTDLKPATDLDHGNVPDYLRQKFGNNGISIPHDVPVRIIESGKKWLIVGKGKSKYYIRERDGRLDVFHSPDFPIPQNTLPQSFPGIPGLSTFMDEE